MFVHSTPTFIYYINDMQTESERNHLFISGLITVKHVGLKYGRIKKR